MEHSATLHQIVFTMLSEGIDISEVEIAVKEHMAEYFDLGISLPQISGIIRIPCGFGTAVPIGDKTEVFEPEECQKRATILYPFKDCQEGIPLREKTLRYGEIFIDVRTLPSVDFLQRVNKFLDIINEKLREMKAPEISVHAQYFAVKWQGAEFQPVIVSMGENFSVTEFQGDMQTAKLLY